MQKKEIIKKNETKKVEKRVSKTFVNILAIISILGFISIISYTLFNMDIEKYIQSLWLGILGLGFILESNPKRLVRAIKTKLEERNFTAITTFIVGLMAIIAGIIALPQINIENPVFLAIKGIISIIAIIFIIIETWIIK